MQVLRAADRAATPWRNGGGVTREVAVWPPGAGFDDFHWRVSMAEVRTDGPFSMFPGVDRVLAILQGKLELCIEDRAILELTEDSPPVTFPGDVPTVARVLGAVVTDLNVMTRRGSAGATLECVSVQRRLDLPPVAEMRLLVARAPLRADDMDLAIDDALVLGSGDAVSLRTSQGAGAYLATFRAKR